MAEKDGLFEGLLEILDLAGFKTIAIGVDHEGAPLRLTGIINIQIIPAAWAEKTDFFNFPQIPQDFLANCREYAAQSRRKENGNCQDGVSDAFSG